MTMPKNNTIITQGMKCYWECFFKKIGWVSCLKLDNEPFLILTLVRRCLTALALIIFFQMDDDGNINEKPINLTPTPCYVKYAFPCLNVTGVDTCDKAANFLNCFNEIYERERSEQGGSCDEDY